MLRIARILYTRIFICGVISRQPSLALAMACPWPSASSAAGCLVGLLSLFTVFTAAATQAAEHSEYRCRIR